MSDPKKTSVTPTPDPRSDGPAPGDPGPPSQDAFKYALLYFVLPLAALLGIYAATS